MGLINVISSSDPIENFAAEHGKQLFVWAQQTWRGFLTQILQLMEGDNISDQDFTLICNRLARVHSAQNPNNHGEMLADWARLVDLPLADLKAWEAGKNLPAFSKREEIVRQILERLVKYVRSVKAEVYMSTMVQLVTLQDQRDPAVFTSVHPKTYRRSIHRLGLPEQVASVLFENNIKTQGDLESYIEPPIPGGLIIDSRRNRNPRPSFDPKEKLKQLNGIDEESAERILKAAETWSGRWSPSQLLV
jgi:hypothetical protein